MIFAILVINTKLLYEKLTIAIDSGLKAIYDSVIVVSIKNAYREVYICLRK